MPYYIKGHYIFAVVVLLNKGSIHSSMTLNDDCSGTIGLREDFAKQCFETLLEFSLLDSGLEAAVESARATLGQMSFVNHNRPAAGGQLIVLNRRFSGAPSSLGNGLLLSVLANDHPDASTGLVVARAVKNVQGSVLQNVLESLVNGSQILMDLSHVEGSRQSVYYFHKPSRDQVSRLCVYT